MSLNKKSNGATIKVSNLNHPHHHMAFVSFSFCIYLSGQEVFPVFICMRQMGFGIHTSWLCLSKALHLIDSLLSGTVVFSVRHPTICF